MVDFQRMQHTNCETNRVRGLRLSLGVPEAWTSTPAALLQPLEAPPCREVRNPDLLAKVRDILQSTGHAWDNSQVCSCMQTARIKSIQRIENWSLWQRYKAKRATMRREHASYEVSVTPAALDLDALGDDLVMTGNQSAFDFDEALSQDVDEKILLHGTSGQNANDIAMNGFRHQTCHGAMYGDGVYFASSACKSHETTCQHHKSACRCTCERTLIIARVALGDAYYARETRYGQSKVPIKTESGVAYDSIVVNPGRIAGHNSTQMHQEFVIVDDEQAYPCYVVQYEL
ncbi:Protein mono-ADP-ribosyltransferase PARP11 (ADP-ribosyltransferase diphtheria toxin-like 11) (ARTD11) (Poly [ADP-ribose] polymerase 11) (PARP-11) [Durusdinium trenchii]